MSIGNGGTSGTVATTKNGQQTLSVEYKDADELYVNPGIIHIIGTGVDTIFDTAVQLTKTVTSLTVSTWYYIYIKPPASGTTITATEIEYSTTAPTRSVDDYGYYHGSNDTWRCVFAIYSDSGSDIEKFYQINNDIIFDNELTAIGPVAPSTTWTDATLTTPLFEGSTSCVVVFYCAYQDAGSNFVVYYRPNGTSATTGIIVGVLNPTSVRCTTRHTLRCDDSGVVEIKHSVTGTDQTTLRPIGFTLPSEVFNK